MTSREIKEYYDATRQREIRPDLTFAISLVGRFKTAIDCGCGAGADIENLLQHGFRVYGFDVEEESIARCQERFKNNNNVILCKSGFATYQYPKAGLIVADASLFFCPRAEFAAVWDKMYECLCPGGVFYGSFLGPDDTMAGPTYDKCAFWPDILIFEEINVRELFKNYQICRFTEHRTSGQTPQGTQHDWHIFSVVAKKS